MIIGDKTNSSLTVVKPLVFVFVKSKSLILVPPVTVPAVALYTALPVYAVKRDASEFEVVS